jgi:hypothetical protein
MLPRYESVQYFLEEDVPSVMVDGLDTISAGDNSDVLSDYVSRRSWAFRQAVTQVAQPSQHLSDLGDNLVHQTMIPISS